MDGQTFCYCGHEGKEQEREEQASIAQIIHVAVIFHLIPPFPQKLSRSVNSIIFLIGIATFTTLLSIIGWYIGVWYGTFIYYYIVLYIGFSLCCCALLFQLHFLFTFSDIIPNYNILT